MKNKSNPCEGNLAKIKKKGLYLLNQKIIRGGQEETQKIKLFNGQNKKKFIANTDNPKGKCIVELYNNTKQMDVHQATRIEFKDDIIMEILSKLHVRYLVQFKCVSKLWNALISEPYFIKKHLNHAKNDPHSQKLIFYRCNLKDYSYTTSIYSCPLSSSKLVDKVQKLDCPLSWSTQIYCSYNGLVVIGAFNRATYKGFKFMLWNPSTRESILLPEPQFLLHGTYCMGLGYDSTSGDYKILIIRNDIGRGKEPGGILALKSGSWRIIDKYPLGIDSWLSGMGSSLAVVNDAFHFICMSGDYHMTSRTFSLVAFSISNEVYTEMSLPKKISCLEGNILVGVSVLDGMLCAYSTYNRAFELWLLKDYSVNESWNPLYIINQMGTIKAVPKHRFADGEVLFWLEYIFFKMTRSFRTFTGPFGIRDAIHNGLGVQDEIAYINETQDGIAFTENLISPKSLI